MITFAVQLFATEICELFYRIDIVKITGIQCVREFLSIPACDNFIDFRCSTVYTWCNTLSMKIGTDFIKYRTRIQQIIRVLYIFYKICTNADRKVKEEGLPSSSAIKTSISERIT